MSYVCEEVPAVISYFTSEFFLSNLLASTNSSNSQISAINKENCPPPLVNTDDKKSWFEGIPGCGIQCENPIFTAEEHDRIHRFIGAFGTLSILCTAFTVVSKLLVKSLFIFVVLNSFQTESVPHLNIKSPSKWFFVFTMSFEVVYLVCTSVRNKF